MQAASNYVQDSVLGGPVETAVTPSYKHREGGETMQALTWQASDKVQVKQMPIPDITQDEDVVLKVTMTTLCTCKFIRARAQWLMGVLRWQ